MTNVSESFPQSPCFQEIQEIKSVKTKAVNTERNRCKELKKKTRRGKSQCCFKAAFFFLSFSHHPSLSSSAAHRSLFLNNPTLGFHHSFEIQHMSALFKITMAAAWTEERFHLLLRSVTIQINQKQNKQKKNNRTGGL